MSADTEEASKVFEVARSLLPAAEALARRFRLDPDTAREAMMEAAKRVLELQQTERGEANPPKVRNLPAYLFTVYRNLMIAELRRQAKELTISDESVMPVVGMTADAVRSVENKILLSEIVQRMNAKSRAIFSYLVLGYSYKEIARRFEEDKGIRVTAATLRSEFSKAIARVTRELEA